MTIWDEADCLSVPDPAKMRDMADAVQAPPRGLRRPRPSCEAVGSRLWAEGERKAARRAEETSTSPSD